MNIYEYLLKHPSRLKLYSCSWNKYKTNIRIFLNNLISEELRSFLLFSKISLSYCYLSVSFKLKLSKFVVLMFFNTSWPYNNQTWRFGSFCEFVFFQSNIKTISNKDLINKNITVAVNYQFISLMFRVQFN